MRHRLLVLAGAGLVGLAAACSSSDVAAPADGPSLVRLPGSSVGGKPIVATLTGAAEVGVVGDADGSGSAIVSINLGRGELCFQFTVANIGTVDAPNSGTAIFAHIHRGSATASGPVVINPTAPVSGSSQGCLTNIAPALLREISADPAGFYVNIHSGEFPAGAVRGQLAER